jgi:hypothetical protein
MLQRADEDAGREAGGDDDEIEREHGAHPQSSTSQS